MLKDVAYVGPLIGTCILKDVVYVGPLIGTCMLKDVAYVGPFIGTCILKDVAYKGPLLGIALEILMMCCLRTSHVCIGCPHGQRRSALQLVS